MSTPTNQDLADWIDAGLDTDRVFEHRRMCLAMRADICFADVLGLAVVGKYGSGKEACARRMALPNRYDQSSHGEMAELLSIPVWRAHEIEKVHYFGGKSAAEIAELLRNNAI